MIEIREETLSLNGVFIIAEGVFSREQVPLPDGDYDRAGLLGFLCDHWIPYTECHQCGRFPYCKFVQRFPDYPDRAREIQCGVVVTVLDNFPLASWNRLHSYNQEELRHFFDGLFCFVQFVREAEVQIGNYMDLDQIHYWGEEHVPRFFGYVSHLRVFLDGFASEFQHLPEFDTAGKWLSVEGDAEEEFLRRLVELRFFTNYVGGIEDYGGKGNLKPSKFQLYAGNLKSRGYSLRLQGEKDGSERNPLDKVVREGIVEKKATFAFSKDFEGAFPPEVLWKALQIAGCEVPIEWLRQTMSLPPSEPITKTLAARTGRPVHKVELARVLADIVSDNWAKLYRTHPRNEIVRWLLSLRSSKREETQVEG